MFDDLFRAKKRLIRELYFYFLKGVLIMKQWKSLAKPEMIFFLKLENTEKHVYFCYWNAAHVLSLKSLSGIFLVRFLNYILYNLFQIKHLIILVFYATFLANLGIYCRNSKEKGIINLNFSII